MHEPFEVILLAEEIAREVEQQLERNRDACSADPISSSMDVHGPSIVDGALLTFNLFTSDWPSRASFVSAFDGEVAGCKCPSSDDLWPCEDFADDDAGVLTRGTCPDMRCSLRLECVNPSQVERVESLRRVRRKSISENEQKIPSLPFPPSLFSPSPSLSLSLLSFLVSVVNTTFDLFVYVGISSSRTRAQHLVLVQNRKQSSRAMPYLILLVLLNGQFEELRVGQAESAERQVITEDLRGTAKPVER